MGLIQLIRGCLFVLRVWVRDLERTIEKHDESRHEAEERERLMEVPSENPKEVRAVITLDNETVGQIKTDQDRQYKIQKSIKNAAWAAFFAACVYALISMLQWGQMIKQSKTANAALRQSIESFRIDERAWIEIEPIKLMQVYRGDSKVGAGFRYGFYPKNFGKTEARDITFRAAPGATSSIQSGNSPTWASFNQDKLLLGKVESAPDLRIDEPAPKVLAPGITSPVPFTMDGQEPQIFSEDEFVSYLIGRIDYVDAFRVKHWVKFCYFVVNAKGDLWNCKEGNDEDENPEMPPD
jgi:hypothetical protein